jgi:hypothetical protein
VRARLGSLTLLVLVMILLSGALIALGIAGNPREWVNPMTVIGAGLVALGVALLIFMPRQTLLVCLTPDGKRRKFRINLKTRKLRRAFLEQLEKNRQTAAAHTSPEARP